MRSPFRRRDTQTSTHKIPFAGTNTHLDETRIIGYTIAMWIRSVEDKSAVNVCDGKTNQDMARMMMRRQWKCLDNEEKQAVRKVIETKA